MSRPKPKIVLDTNSTWMVAYGMSVPHITTAIRIPKALYVQLKTFNIRDRRSISFTVARALEMYLSVREMEDQSKRVQPTAVNTKRFKAARA